jgi:hypothetical protein
MEKSCTRCKADYEATLENFAPDKRASDNLQSQCRVCDREKVAEYRRKNPNRKQDWLDGNEERAKATGISYYSSKNGDLHRKFNNMKYRCSNQKAYVAKGIKNKFKNFEHFRSYVVEVLGVDPRGLVCHRPDNDGHYEEGNIEFVTRTEHKKIHKV